ncbi:MAG: leucine-rich repeat domain-containing protein [Bacteroidales bacterium]|nr:leucine-rich repeat domain-containing protein [Bacteroidales bacterium]
MKKLLLLLLAAVTSLTSFAGDAFEYTYEGYTLKYKVIDEDNATCQLNSCKSDYSGKVIIPEYAINNGKQYHVTEIGDAFYRCTGLTNITLPNSVTSIGEGAFNYCTSLTNITLPNSVTSIGKEAFYGCESLTNITIPNYVTTIGSHAFSGCESLTNITIPNSVKEIGEYLFMYCENLRTVRINKLINAEVKNKLVEQVRKENKERTSNPIQIVYF